MSTLSKFQQLRASSKTTKNDSTIICLEIMPCKIKKLHPTTWRGNSDQKRTVSTDSRPTRLKICKKRAPNEKLPTQKLGEIPALHASQRNQSTDLQRKSID